MFFRNCRTRGYKIRLVIITPVEQLIQYNILYVTDRYMYCIIVLTAN